MTLPSGESAGADLAPRRMPSQERSRKRFHAILDAFAALLVEKGFDGLNTHMVAERAGVPVGTLYQFFPNKFALAAALSRRYAAGYEGFTQAKLDAQQPLPSLDTVLDRLVDAIAPMLFADEAVIRLWAITQVVPELAEVRHEANAMTLRICQAIIAPYLPDLPRERVDAVSLTVSRLVYALLFAACQERETRRDATVAELRRAVKAYVGSYQTRGGGG